MSFIAAAVIGGVGALAGGVISASGAESAAGQQAAAAENAQNISKQEFNTITQQEQPFLQGGYKALSSLETGLGIGGDTSAAGYGALNQPFTISQFQKYSPAYKFALQQGGQGVLNSDTSGQGALSGAALKDLTGYNSNYANLAFNNAFNQYQTQIQNTYGRLASLVGTGSSAAANLGAQGTTLAGQEAQSATNIGTAQAGGTVGAANAISGGLSGAGNYALLGSILNNNQPQYPAPVSEDTTGTADNV